MIIIWTRIVCLCGNNTHNEKNPVIVEMDGWMEKFKLERHENKSST